MLQYGYKNDGNRRRRGEVMAERIDKIIADIQNCTRSQARTMIRRGEVTVGGAVIREIGWKVDPQAAEICLCGRALHTGPCYIMMNKPAGVISASRSAGERTVLDLLPTALRRKGLFPAGRLDKDTTGFLILTDDGAFAHRILSPRRHVEKEYEALLDHPASDGDIQIFAQGMKLQDGTQFKPGKLTLDQTRMIATVIIREGQYHQVKRMFEFVGNRVCALKRLRIGGLCLDGALAPGEAREMTPEEVKMVLDGCSE